MESDFKEHIDLWLMRINQAKTDERKAELLEECLLKSPVRPNRHKIQVKKTVLEIIDNLTGRSGFDGVWDSIDSDIEEEIMSELETIIERRLYKE
jgi:hypothetical protein